MSKFPKVSILIPVYNRERTIRYLAPLFPLAGPEEKQRLMDRYRDVLFPEDHVDALAYVKKAKEAFEKLRKVHIYIKPFRPRAM